MEKSPDYNALRCPKCRQRTDFVERATCNTRQPFSVPHGDYEGHEPDWSLRETDDEPNEPLVIECARCGARVWESRSLGALRDTLRALLATANAVNACNEALLARLPHADRPAMISPALLNDAWAALDAVCGD